MGRRGHAAARLDVGDEPGPPRGSSKCSCLPTPHPAPRPAPHPTPRAPRAPPRALPRAPVQIPRIDFDDVSSGQPKGFSNCTHLRNGTVVGGACRQFEPPCPRDNGWYSQDPVNSADVQGECSGDWVGGRILDTVLLPATLAPGDYVLGFRWDCEESTQVWSSCADVTILAA